MSEILECGHPESPHSDITRGYGQDEAGNRYCYACCADRDRKTMTDNGVIALYLVQRGNEYRLINWPGSLEFIPHHVRRSPHGGGFGSQRTDAWFSFNGEPWHAVCRGDMDLARCHRLKS
jgi:hypothetical protein